MRILAAAILAMLAAAPAAASKPPANDDFERATLRIRAVAECTSRQMSGDPDYSRGSPLAACQCAIDRYMEGRDVDALRPLVSSESKGLLDQALAQCRGERSGPDVDNALKAARDLENAAKATERMAQRDSSSGDPLATPPAEKPGFDPAAWLEGISLPRWTWAAIPALIIGLFLLLGGRRRSDDLLGPPPSMRPGADPDRPDDPRS